MTGMKVIGTSGKKCSAIQWGRSQPKRIKADQKEPTTYSRDFSTRGHRHFYSFSVRLAGRQRMFLSDLLTGKGIDPEQVLVLRHRPHERQLNKVLPWLAAERPDVSFLVNGRTSWRKMLIAPINSSSLSIGTDTTVR